jgi:pyridoxal phosphate enzyme (YggS family)
VSRQQELQANLKSIKQEIEVACDRANRNPDEVTLIAITKNFPSSDIERLYDLGIRDFGESKMQEFSQKYDELELVATWHFIGQVQSNKIREITRIADVIHSVDSAGHIEKFNRNAHEIGKVLNLLIQVNLDPDFPNGRGGVSREGVDELSRVIHGLGNVTLGGLMFIASPKITTQQAFGAFAPIVQEFKSLHPSAGIISAGMSSDFEDALAIGATHLRIGSKLLGNRPL